MRSLFFLFAVCLMAGCGAHYESEQGRTAFVHWNEGVGRAVEHVEGADAASFQQLKNGEYAKDENHVYWRGVIISNAEPGTFELITGRYGKDSQHVYVDQNVVEEADPATFQKLSGKEIWGRDRNDFYYGHEAQHISGPATFIIINDGWAKDAQVYYAYGFFHHTRRADCDYSSMKILNDHWAKDARRAYYEGKPVEGVDVATFHTVGEFDAKDKFRGYGDPAMERFKSSSPVPRP